RGRRFGRRRLSIRPAGWRRWVPRQPLWRLCGVCSAWIRSPYAGAVGKKTVFWLSRKTTTPRKVIVLPGGWSAATQLTPATDHAVGLGVPQGTHHPGFLVISVVAVKRPLTGVVGDQVRVHRFAGENEDSVLAQAATSGKSPGMPVQVHRMGHGR